MVLNYLVFSKKIQQNLKKNLKTFKLIFLCKKKNKKNILFSYIQPNPK